MLSRYREAPTPHAAPSVKALVDQRAHEALKRHGRDATNPDLALVVEIGLSDEVGGDAVCAQRSGIGRWIRCAMKLMGIQGRGHARAHASARKTRMEVRMRRLCSLKRERSLSNALDAAPVERDLLRLHAVGTDGASRKASLSHSVPLAHDRGRPHLCQAQQLFRDEHLWTTAVILRENGTIRRLHTDMEARNPPLVSSRALISNLRQVFIHTEVGCSRIAGI